MAKFCSSITWLIVFIPKFSVLLLMSDVQMVLPSEESLWQSFPASEDEISSLTADRMRRHSDDEPVSSNFALSHGHSNRRSDSEVLLQHEQTADTDLSSRTALNGALQFGDMGLNVPGSEFPEGIKDLKQNRRHRRRKSKTSSAFLRRISPDFAPLNNPHHPGRVFKSTEENEQPGHSFGEFHDRNQHSGYPHVLRSQDQPFLTDSDNSGTQEISYESDSPSPIGRFDAEPFSEHRSSRDEHRYGSENRHQRIQTRQVFLNHQQQQQSSQHSVRNRNPHSEFHSDESVIRDSDVLGRQRAFHHSNSPVSLTADSDTNLQHPLSSMSELYENEQPREVPQTEVLESDRLGPFSSNGRMKQEFIQYPERSFADEGPSVWHQQRYDLRSPVSAADNDGLPINSDLEENFPVLSSSSIESNLEYQDDQQQENEYPSLDICSEDTHTFYNGAISPSSPMYEIEPFLPQNFNEIFLNELLQKFRPYEHPNVGDTESVCNHNLRFDNTEHANTRAMCPFEWNVSGYNSSRYPPYLMTAECTCQLSKPVYRERSVCREKKGRIPVLWRTGCNDGKHVYREGWDEINVACVPKGYLLTPGEIGGQLGTFHKPSV